jgi:transcriptional regulator with GAF, ATPase, and Fis domain
VNLRLCSVLCVPLLDRANVLGVMYLGNDNVVSLFTEQHREAVTIFAAQASLILARALALDELKDSNASLQAGIEAMRFGTLIGGCEAMQQVYRRVQKVAATDVSVLITGETGTGKELIAREIHNRSERSKGPFITINCGAIPENLLESELFGHVKGAFTGATTTRTGKFQAANGGTLFLDEIGEMPVALQVKILRALQERTITRVGANESEKIDIRVIAATHRDLPKRIAEGAFREDLYYRLNVVPLHLPPLRERGDDIVLIAQYFLDRTIHEYRTPRRQFGRDTVIAMKKAAWPGNIRQLENHVRKAVILGDGTTVHPSDLELDLIASRAILPLAEAREEWQRRYISSVLELNDGNRTQTARDLGVDPRTIFRFLEKEGDRSEDDDPSA